MLFSTILIFLIGFMFSNNLTLSQTPSRWGAKYFANPGGWNLNLSEPTLIPALPALLGCGGGRGRDSCWCSWRWPTGSGTTQYARQLLQFGGKAFMYATMAQIVVGIVFLVSLPRDLRMLFMGDNPLATTLLLVGVSGGIGAIFLMSDALRKENIRAASIYVPGILAVVILCMSVMRDILRDAYLKPYFHPEQFAMKTQWAVFPLFLALFVAGVILWLVMLKRYGLFGGAPAAARPADQK